eukprot:CAMPEP_0194242690 /NCGR_PEP_ID=MMETSP0158-20130606/8147_1 /TAXON_ID=33649 /ORGANISM="Thalassionema nitzschioides, Strain L26-B" /LENGTH=280 /DNA_ID=CAMNT_0038977833 /DNA_START=274 /DNA_END=1117 /DNA_ORIENTATION=+
MVWEFIQNKAHLANVTIVIPAYNEEKRIGTTLQSYSCYLNARLGGSSKIVVVDDGSTDGTVDLVCDSFSEVKVISLTSNQGKGGAVAIGIQYVCDFHSSCNAILVADADGSANIQNIDIMLEALVSVLKIEATNAGKSSIDWLTPAVVVGKRQSVSSSPARLLLRWGFRTTVSLLVGKLNVSDTQCGFKIFTPSAAKTLYNELNLKGWTHDVEVLYRANKLFQYPVREVPIQWEDKDGSKLVKSTGGVVGISFIMLCQVFWLRVAYKMRWWTVASLQDEE